MQRSKILLGLAAIIALHAALLAEEPAKKAAKPTTANKDVEAAFERLKSLAGDWQVEKSPDGKFDNKIGLRYRVIAGGSAVCETIFPDQPMEMISIYHLDGDQLVLTHYCCVGNQPRMRAKIGGPKDELVFDFAGGSNLDPAKDWHIHNGRLQFVDADHLHAEWAYHVDGKEAGKHAFDLIRKK